MSVEFHPLRVIEVTPLTEDSAAVTLEVPEALATTFAYLPGHHVTIRADIEGDDVRRSYSICSNANSGKLRVGIKRLPGGVFSNWAIDRLRAGDVVDVMAPVGEFTIDPDPGFSGHRVAIAAGSGITPVPKVCTMTETGRATPMA